MMNGEEMMNGGEMMNDDSNNLALLQPSERWPGDHCAVFCYVDAAENEGLKRIVEAEAQAAQEAFFLGSTDPSDQISSGWIRSVK